ncbi:hypothetical protein GCK32_016016 [Trichostrongylus colubriformis]|uniref:Uncharacterized protein n=1 Tax=Trichostrongylus colubriformis TaxID=6319 RepID=A0AAN8IPA6_TRICO
MLFFGLGTSEVLEYYRSAQQERDEVQKRYTSRLPQAEMRLSERNEEFLEKSRMLSKKFVELKLKILWRIPPIMSSMAQVDYFGLWRSSSIVKYFIFQRTFDPHKFESSELSVKYNFRRSRIRSLVRLP